jgi:hypothetical protein
MRVQVQIDRFLLFYFSLFLKFLIIIITSFAIPTTTAKSPIYRLDLPLKAIDSMSRSAQNIKNLVPLFLTTARKAPKENPDFCPSKLPSLPVLPTLPQSLPTLQDFAPHEYPYYAFDD